MAWPTAFADGETLTEARLGEWTDAQQTWPGAVNANGQNLSNLATVTFAAGGSITQDAWTDITLVASWVLFGAGASPAKYRKYKNGDVALKGLISGGTIADGTVIATLPVGYRPLQLHAFPVQLTSGQGQLNANTDGTLMIYGVGSNTLLSLDGVRFPTT